jgi:hypothetical protein
MPPVPPIPLEEEQPFPRDCVSKLITSDGVDGVDNPHVVVQRLVRVGMVCFKGSLLHSGSCSYFK